MAPERGDREPSTGTKYFSSRLESRKEMTPKRKVECEEKGGKKERPVGNIGL